MAVAVPAKLLSFRGGRAQLEPAGLAMIEAAPGPVRPIVIVGDGRSGKSTIASAVANWLGYRGTSFRTGNSCTPVTDGIDVLALRVQGYPGSFLLFDCEGTTNPVGAVREEVSLFGYLLAGAGTVMYLTDDYWREPQTQCLARIAASRQLLHGGPVGAMPKPRLILVCNMTRPCMDQQREQELLSQELVGGARGQERTAILAAFQTGIRMAHVPMMKEPGYAGALQGLCQAAQSTSPTTLGGLEVDGQQLKDLIIACHKQLMVEGKHVIDVPDLLTASAQAFLGPLVQQLCTEQESYFAKPDFHTYQRNFHLYDPTPSLLQAYNEKTARLQHPLRQTYREALASYLEERSARQEQTNTELGQQVETMGTESREECVSSYSKKVGRRRRSGIEGFFGGRSDVYATVKVYRQLTRTTMVRKNGETSYSDWVEVGRHERFEQ